MPGPTIFSRTRFCSAITNSDGALILTDPAPYTTPLADDTTVTVTDGDSLTRLAFRFYGRAELWWVIADRNHIYDPTVGLTAGQTLVVPSSRTVSELILNESRRVEFQA
jgi:nucleoid-associated protein YgaU